MPKRKDKSWTTGIFLGIGIALIVLLIVVVVILVQNNQEQAEIQRELQRQQEEKEFCDNLRINIKPFDITSYGYGVATAGVNYKFCSNKETSAKSIITLKNGQQIEENVGMGEGECSIQQIQYASGFEGSGYGGGVSCDDIKSIELISTRCPQVKDIVTDTSELTCGI